eukprot:g24801.t1
MRPVHLGRPPGTRRVAVVECCSSAWSRRAASEADCSSSSSSELFLVAFLAAVFAVDVVPDAGSPVGPDGAGWVGFVVLVLA